MNENLFEIFRRSFPADLGRVFLERPDGSVLSYADLLDLSGRVAQVLMDLGVKPGDRVAAQVEKSAEALMLYLGSAARRRRLPAAQHRLHGGRDPLLPRRRRADRCSSAGPELAGADGGAGPRSSACRTCSTLGEHGDGSLWAKVQAAVAGDVDVPRGKDDLAAFLYTSGTTGRSKGAMLSHGNLASNAAALRDAWRFTADDRLLHALPIFHTHGLFVATNITLMAGGSLIFLPRFDLADMMRLLPKATAMMGVPTFYTRLLSRPDFTRELVAHMRLFVSGSAPLSAETHKEFSARTGHAILERYGMTETNMNTSNPYDGDRIPGSVGHAAAGRGDPHHRPGDRRRAAAGRDRHDRGPRAQRVQGLLADAREDQGRVPRGRLLHLRRPRLHRPARLRLHLGRGKDLIISGGFNVYPAEVEGAIEALPGVAECAVIGVPHADFGEGVVAVVTAKPGAALDEKQMIAALGSELAKYKLPKRIFIADSLPRNAMGKVQKNQLREQHKATFSAGS